MKKVKMFVVKRHGVFFNHVHPTYTEKMAQVNLTIFEVVVEGYHECSFAVDTVP